MTFPHRYPSHRIQCTPLPSISRPKQHLQPRLRYPRILAKVLTRQNINKGILEDFACTTVDFSSHKPSALHTSRLVKCRKHAKHFCSAVSNYGYAARKHRHYSFLVKQMSQIEEVLFDNFDLTSRSQAFDLLAGVSKLFDKS